MSDNRVIFVYLGVSLINITGECKLFKYEVVTILSSNGREQLSIETINGREHLS